MGFFGLTDVATVKGALRIPAGITQHDAALARFVEEAERHIMGELRLTGLTETSYTERVQTYGNAMAMVRRMPIQSVISVTDCDSVLASDAYEWDETGLIRKIRGFFSTGRNVVVTYTAGFTTANGGTIPPANLAHAATLRAAMDWNKTPRAGLKEQETGDYTTQLDIDRAYPEEYERIMNSFRRIMG